MKFVKVIKVLAVALLLLGAFAYVLLALVAFRSVEDELKFHDLEIRFRAVVPLFAEEEIHLLLRERGLHPIGASIKNLRSDQIERYLNEHPYVKRAMCYHNPSGKVVLRLDLRTPRFLVMGNENYYVDEDRFRMPVNPGVMAYVPVLTGRVTNSMLEGELFELVSFIATHEFWNAQIQQIHVRNDLKIELVPRIGEAIILMGDAADYQLKLDRLFRLYQQAFNVMGWNGYSMLDLRFNNQVVAVKKESL
jgi:cell division protein FtsQ